MTAQAATLQLSEKTNKISLNSHFQIFEDKSGKLDLSQVSEPQHQQQFADLRGTLNAGYTHSAFWLKLDLQRLSDTTERDWLLEMTPAMLDDIRLYQTDNGGQIQIQRAGDHLAFNQQVVRHHYPLFQIHLDDTEAHTLYIRIQSSSALFFRATLFDQKSFSEDSNYLSGMLGVYYGIMLAMIIYNCLLMMSDRDLSMRHYLLLSISTLIAGLSVNGHVGLYIAPDWPWLVDILPAVMPQMIVLSSSMFMCSFLKLKFTLPRAYIVFRSIQVCALLLVIAILVGFQPQVAGIAQFLGLIQICLYGPVSLMVAVRGYAPGYVVMLASGIWMSGTVLIPLRNLGLLESTWVTDFGFQIGSAIDVILLALAQAYRIRLIQKESHMAQQQLLRVSQQAETELDAKVKRRTAELDQLIQRLEKSDKEKNDLLSIAVHDLKSPLTGIIGMSELLLKMYHRIPKEEQQSYLNRINASGKRMMHIVTNMLDMNAMESGNLVFHKQTLNLGKLLNEIALQYEEMLKAKELTAIVHIEENVLISADTNAMTRVLDNLISNAIKFSPAGKFIWLTVCHHEGSGRFEVKDQGPGLSVKDQQFLFTKFSKLSAVPTAGEHSSGLGLSIVKKLIEAQGGVVNCSSTAGEGASFSVDLPAAIVVQPQTSDVQAA